MVIPIRFGKNLIAASHRRMYRWPPTTLKAVNFSEEHHLNTQNMGGIDPCEIYRSPGQNNIATFAFQSITEDDVKKIIKSLTSNKAPGCDKANAKTLKDSLPVIAPVITSLINNSFLSSSFPLSWKKAEIVPILKSGDSEEPANTRPISLLPLSVSKVCERAAHSQLVNFLSSNDIIIICRVEIENFIRLICVTSLY